MTLTKSTEHRKLISFFEPGQLSSPSRYIGLDEAYRLIQDGYTEETKYIQDTYKDGILTSWEHTDKGAYQQDKKRLLPAVCFSGNIDRSTDSDDFCHSGLICLDIDENSKEELDAAFRLIRTGKLTVVEAAARSVSGILNGSFWTNIRIEVPADVKQIPLALRKMLDIRKGEGKFSWTKKLHEGYHRALSALFKKELDILVGSSKDLKRVRYITHDSEAYTNTSASVYPMSALAVQLEALQQEDRKRKAELDGFDRQTLNIKEQDAFKFAEQFAQQQYTFTDGQKHLYLTRLSICLNLLGIDQDEALRYIESTYLTDIRSNCVSYPYSHYRESFGSWSWKLRPAEAAADYTFTLPAGQKLSFFADQVADIYRKESSATDVVKIDFKSGTGTGKNYVVIKHLAAALKELNGCRTVLVCSLNSKAEKDADQYSLHYITGERLAKDYQRKKEIWTEAMSSDVILCNQNSFPKIARHFSKKDEQLNVFIDESQTLVDGMQDGYKPDVIQALMTAAGKVSKTLTLMSGTPKPYFQPLGFKRIDVKQEQRPVIRLLVRTRMKDIHLTALKHIQQTDFKKSRLVIKIQSKNTIRRLRQLLISEGFRKDEIVTLYSEKSVKQSKEYRRFLSANKGQESFEDKVKVILCTSFINEGLDIYSSYQLDFINIEKNACFNVEELVQFADRHRTDQDKTLYSYHPEAEPETSGFNALYHFDQLLGFWRKEVHGLQEKKAELEALTADVQLMSFLNNYSDFEKFAFYDSEEGVFKVNVLALMSETDKIKVKHTPTTVGLQQITEQYPYFQVTDQRTPTETDEAGNKIIEKLKAADQLAKRDVHRKLEQLYRTDREVLLQAIASASEDVQLKKRATFDQGRKAAAAALIQANTDIFDGYFTEAERLAKTHFKLLYYQLGEGDLAGMLFTEDDDGIRMTSRQKLATFLNGLKIHLLLFLAKASVRYQLDGQNIGALTAVQFEQSLTFLTLAETLDTEAAKNGRKLTPKQIFLTVAAVYRKAGLKTSMTQNKAVQLANILFDTERKTDRDAVYHFKRRVSLNSYLDRYGIDKKALVSNLDNLLKVSSENPTDLPF